MNPKISVVTVCYNAVNDIERTILSVINQTYPNIEYIIIDGGSKDGTMDVVNRYKDNIDVIVSEPDKGIYDAMNKGIDRATGEWINFMNAGDRFVNKNTIHSLASYFVKENKIVYGNIIKVYKKWKGYGKPLTKENPDAVDFILNGIDHQASFINSDLFKKYGLYSTDYQLASDWFFFMLVAGIKRERILYINKPLAYFYMNGISSHNQDRYAEEQDLILKKLFGDSFPYMKELAEFRKSTFLCLLLRIRLSIKKNKISRVLRFIQHVILKK